MGLRGREAPFEEKISWLVMGVDSHLAYPAKIAISGEKTSINQREYSEFRTQFSFRRKLKRVHRC